MASHLPILLKATVTVGITMPVKAMPTTLESDFVWSIVHTFHYLYDQLHHWCLLTLLYITDEQDLIEVIEALDGVESKYYSIGLAFGLRASDLDNIRANHGRDVRQAMEQVLKSWLILNYDYERFGKPTWRKAVEVAHKRPAGDNPARAKAIAADHPLDSKLTCIQCY